MLSCIFSQSYLLKLFAAKGMINKKVSTNKRDKKYFLYGILGLSWMLFWCFAYHSSLPFQSCSSDIPYTKRLMFVIPYAIYFYSFIWWPRNMLTAIQSNDCKNRLFDRNSITSFSTKKRMWLLYLQINVWTSLKR